MQKLSLFSLQTIVFCASQWVSSSEPRLHTEDAQNLNLYMLSSDLVLLLG